jgi:hypothetical protein
MPKDQSDLGFRQVGSAQLDEGGAENALFLLSSLPSPGSEPLDGFPKRAIWTPKS